MPQNHGKIMQIEEMKCELIDHMGSDLTVVNAARVSMNKSKTEFDDKDAKLLQYLAKHGHWTPFAQPQLQFRFTAPIFVARQWFKHVIGTVRNEVSRRYVDDPPTYFIPDAWRSRAESVKQGSKDDEVPQHLYVDKMVRDHYKASDALYEHLLKLDVAPELARIVLPQSMTTQWIETMSLATCARICKLRLDAHAQKEIRNLTEQMYHLAAPRFPVSMFVLMGVCHG